MNILFVHRVSDRSEASLLKWMCEQGDRVSVICDPQEPRLKEFEAAGAHVVALRVSNRLDLRAIPKIRQLCKNKPIDILYSSFNAGISTSLIATLGLPTKVIAYRGTLGNLSRLDPSSYLTHLSPRLNGVICNCPPIKDFLISLGIPSGSIDVVFKGHAAEWYTAKTPPSKEELGIPPDHLVIGLVANMRPLKGVECLLDAVEPLLQEYPLTVLLIGSDKDGAITAKVDSMTGREQVKLLGFRKDAAEIASYFDIACLPSTRREGVPRSIVEAMAHGKPCVVTDVGGLPHIVSHEENGLVVPPNNVEALKGALKTLLSYADLRKQYGENSRKRFDEQFDLEKYHTAMRYSFTTFSNDLPTTITKILAPDQ